MKPRYRLISLGLLIALMLSIIPLAPFIDAAVVAGDKTSVKSVAIDKISVPAYSGGTTSGWMIYDGGLATAIGNTSGQSKMRIVTGTTTAQYSTYLTTLKNAGYVKLFGRAVPAQSGSNRHDKHLSPDGTYALYTYWTPATREVRIIVDTHVDTLRTFNYESVNRGNGRTEVYACSLQYATDGHRDTSTANTEYRSNAGSLFVIKMPDNSLFVVDGGDFHQMGDRECEQLFSFMRRITGTNEMDKIVINTWFISHNHFDHVSGFPRFLHKYSTKLELYNIMYNFDAEGSAQKYIRRAAQLFPDAKYYKQHTGESFKIAGVQFDVLYTVEDRYTPNSKNELILEDATCLGAYEDSNNVSTVLRMTFDGKTMLLTGDLNEADARLMKMYPASALKCDLLQIPHHSFDTHTTLVKTVAPSVSFINQAESAMMNRKDTYDNNTAWKPYAGEIYFCGDRTVGYAADAGIFFDEHMDSVDYLDWKAQSYYCKEATYYDGSTEPIADPEQYYRYTRVTELSKTDEAYAIVDDKLGKVLSYDAVTGIVSNANPAFQSGDEYYFSASQRRSVNWLMSYSNSGVKSGQAISGATTYYGTVPIYKGSGDYWGAPSEGRYLAIANGDTFESKGMYSSWTSLPNMLESSSKELWIDLLPDGYFLIYRYTGGNYYPLYRDGNGNVTKTNDGWGSAKITQAKISAQADYLRHRLYAYNDTPDTMLIYWTGHKDFYTYMGTPLNDVKGLITADLRIRYEFKTFSGSGEITYDGWNTQKEGTYWLEFNKSYDANTPGDYPVTIKYKNASGTILTLGEITVHVQNSADDPEAQQLFFDFDDGTISREKYKYRAQYSEFNFDSARRWEFIEYHADNKTNKTSEGIVDSDEGTIQILSATNDDGSRNLSIRTFALDNTPLNYDPTEAEVIQVRLKMDNMKTFPGKNSYFRLWYYKNNGAEDIYTYEKDYFFGKEFVSDGEYMVITVELYTEDEISALTAGSQTPTQTFNSCSSITGLRPAFHNLTPVDPTKPSGITVDYIYIGPKKDLPYRPHTVRFCGEDGTLLQEQIVMTGEAAIYNGILPTKSYNQIAHYSFAGWSYKDGTTAVLDKINTDVTVYATFAEIEHTFINHICECGAVEDTKPVVDESVKIYHTLDLASDISITFAVTKASLANYESYYLKCILPEYKGNELVGTSTVEVQPIDKGSYYYFTLTGITAVRMGDMVDAVLHMTKDGQEFISKTDSYSVATYAYATLEKSADAKMLTLCADLLRYGALAQSYKGYRTDALVDAAMTAAQKAYLSDTNALTFAATDSYLGDSELPFVTWIGKTLDLGSKVGLKFVFNTTNYAGNIADLTMKVSYTGGNGEIKTAILTSPEAYGSSGTAYSFTFYGLLASELRTIVDVAIYEGDMQISETLRYSAESYAAKSSAGALGDLCKALFAYSDSAKAYFAK